MEDNNTNDQVMVNSHCFLMIVSDVQIESAQVKLCLYNYYSDKYCYYYYDIMTTIS